MDEDIIYNQILTFSPASLTGQLILRSYVEEGKLILVLEDSQKVLIDGRNVNTTGHRERIQELVSLALEKGIECDPKSVMHYADCGTDGEDMEYVLIKW
ncbi:MAG: hypothetical protein Q8O92_11980 [Candidatus Latescibacter sp.]|nr:hypothetical protein [Candidatus Latescibacter sp.]